MEASLAATKRVHGRVVVYGLPDGEAAITNWDLVYRHQIHLIGLNIGTLIQAAPHMFGEVMGEMFGLLSAGVLRPTQPTTYPLADGPTALAELEARATVGKLALLPISPDKRAAGRAKSTASPSAAPCSGALAGCLTS